MLTPDAKLWAWRLSVLGAIVWCALELRALQDLIPDVPAGLESTLSDMQSDVSQIQGDVAEILSAIDK